jgi:ABC-2 type transport system ATP-binding protein
MPAIDIHNLVVHYHKHGAKPVEAVRGLSLSVQPGEVVGFLGPNGAGKSSTLKALMGFVRPTSGQADIFGLPAGSEAARRRIGYLPEVAMYYPFLTPLETLTLYGELQGLRGKALRREAETLLELVGLGGAIKRQNRTMSKGMLQRVGIAQSLLGNPDLLILDEVTSGLDPVGRKELRTLLLDRRAQGATLFFSSHELAEVEMLCDRILLIDRGRLIEERSIHELKDSIRRYAVTFTGSTSMVGLTDRLASRENGHIVAEFDGKEGLLAAIERIQQNGATVVDIVAQEGSLENYFIETIGRAA